MSILCIRLCGSERAYNLRKTLQYPLAIACIALAACLAGCARHEKKNEAANHRSKIIAQAECNVDGVDITITSIQGGPDFRVIQYSQSVSLEVEIRHHEGGPIKLGELDRNAEWFDGKNMVAVFSGQLHKVFLFRHFNPAVEGLLVFRNDLGQGGGWYTIPKSELKPEEVIQYGYSLIGAVDVEQGTLYSRLSLRERVGLDPESSPMQVRPNVILNGVEVPIIQIPLRRVVQ